MPTDAIIVILIVAIVANLVIMGLLVLNLWVRRRGAADSAARDAQKGVGKADEVGQMADAPRLQRAIAGERAETYGRAQPSTDDAGLLVAPATTGAPLAEPPLAEAPVAPAPPAAAPPAAAASEPVARAQPADDLAPDAPGFEAEPPPDLLRDPVTGLESAYAWERHLREEADRLRRYGRPFAIVYAELDGLDRLADRVGADAAGRIVPAIGHVLQAQARAVDVVARVGPARFAVLLPETDEVRAINYVERVRGACDVWLQAGAVALQLSFGWASPGPEADTHTAQLRADERLQGELATVRRRGAGLA